MKYDPKRPLKNLTDQEMWIDDFYGSDEDHGMIVEERRLREEEKERRLAYAEDSRGDKP